MAAVSEVSYKVTAVVDHTATPASEHNVTNGEKAYCWGTDATNTWFLCSKLAKKDVVRWCQVAHFEEFEALKNNQEWAIPAARPAYPPNDVGLMAAVQPKGTRKGKSTAPAPGGQAGGSGQGTQQGTNQPVTVNVFESQGTYVALSTEQMDDDDKRTKVDIIGGQKYEVVGWKGPDDVIVKIKNQFYWGKTAWFTPPAKPAKHRVAEFANAVGTKLNVKGVVIPGPATDNILVGFGEWLWFGAEAIGKAAWGLDKAILDAIIMPQLRMYREPESWTYRARLRPIGASGTQPTAPTADQFGQFADAEIEGGGPGQMVAGVGAASSGVMFSTVAFFSWPFRKWAGPQYTEDKTPSGAQNAYLRRQAGAVDPMTEDWSI